MKFGRVLAVVAACMAAPWVCHASDGTVTITGTVTNETCQINGGGSGSTFAVALPNVSPAALNGSTPTAGRTRFSLVLTNCTGFAPGSTLVYPNFEPGPTVNPAGRLSNTIPQASGGATNVDIELLNSSFQAMNLALTAGNQGATQGNVSGTPGSATLIFYAQYRASGAGLVGPGTVSTNVTYSLVYP